MIEAHPPPPRPMPRLFRNTVSALLLAIAAHAGAATLRIVAAESTYGAIAQAIGGTRVQVVSLIRNPDVDPHAFEASPQAARTVAQAQLVLMNGLGYDHWMRQLLQANPVPGRTVLVAADLLPQRRLPDGNPHVFYDPRVGLRMADAIAAWLRHADPAHAADFDAAQARLRQRMTQVIDTARQLALAHPALPVAATEPVWGYMVRELRWRDLHHGLQVHVMNGTEPSPREVAAMDTDLRRRAVALLIHNRQVSSPLTRSMLALARRCGVPTLGVDEFTPPGVGYAQWLLDSLQAAQRALAAPAAPTRRCDD